MANELSSNITRQLKRTFIPALENKRSLSKSVNTQLFSGSFNPSTGDTIDVKRPADYITQETDDGDISATNPSDIIAGKASATVQQMITVEVNYNTVEEALELDQMEELVVEPATRRLVTTLELNFGRFAMRNCGLLAGTYGTAASTWDHIAEAGAVMEANGVPMSADWYYFVNPYTQRSLASNQRSLGSGGTSGELVSEAHRRATISEDFAGFRRVLTATTMATHTQPATGDRVGSLSATPTATYVAAKDTMTQSLAVTGFGSFTGTIPAGTVVQVTGRNRLNLSTREPVIDETGNTITWTAVLTANASLTSGAGTFIVSGPGIFEAAGAYNTVDSALTSGDVVTLLGADSTTYQPNMFWHKDAFTIASVPLKKLNSTDTVMTTKDGLQIRISKGTSVRENKQILRFDLHPAFGVMNPFMAGQGFGS